MGYEQEKQEVAWNLSQHIIFRINDLLHAVSNSFLRGNLQSAFWYAREIRIMIMPDFNPEELKKLKEKEKEIMESRNKSKGQQSYLITEYREKIMGYLDDFGYLVAKKKDPTKAIIQY